MFSDFSGDVRARILKTFPERQIYLRSGGEVTYFNLPTRLQVAVVSAIGFMALWCLLSLLNILFSLNPFSASNQEIAEYEARYERLLASSQAKEESARLAMAEQRASFERMAANIEAKHNTLSQIVGTVGLPATASFGANTEFASADILVHPVSRDTVERVARRASLESEQTPMGLDAETTLASLDLNQNRILLNAEADLLDDIEFNRAIIRATEMDVEAVLQEGAQGQGGPYIPVDEFEMPNAEGQFHSRIASIQARLYESQALENVLSTLPLAHPVENETVLTSAFGVRSDPFTKRPTIHYGLDFIGGTNAPIVATAPGTVTFAGRKGAYGRVVEIDHGHGFMTRYAHLNKTFVKPGQTVEKGERVGGMGSTGRSTATHLHYEVHFQGRAYDPQKFLKAGLHVQ